MMHCSPEELEALRDKVKDVQFGMLTTVNQMGSLSSRPLTLQELDGTGTMWFFVSDEQPFIQDLASTPSVNISFTDVSDHLYVSISGQAELVRDRAKTEQLWNVMAKAWFPQGVDDPHLALLKIGIHGAEYWDTGHGKMSAFFAMAKAALSGTRPKQVGEHHQLGQS